MGTALSTARDPEEHFVPVADQAERCAMPPTIFVVDDDPEFRHDLVELLRNVGYRIEQASDGLLPLRQIARHVPDLVLSDVRMPHLDRIGLATVLDDENWRNAA